jgi:hypothetical protein
MPSACFSRAGIMETQETGKRRTWIGIARATTIPECVRTRRVR